LDIGVLGFFGIV